MLFDVKMKIINLNTYKEYAVFFWLLLIVIFGISVSKIYSKIQIEQNTKINSTLDNIYFKKTFKEITKNLEPRFTFFEYISKSGDNYQIIINKLDISTDEKEEILLAIKDQKNLKVLKINQKFLFKIDNLSEVNVIEFKIETDKKNEIIFVRSKKMRSLLLKS